MNLHQKSLRVGMVAISAAILLRFFSFTWIEAAIDYLTDPKVVAFLIYAETGRDVRFAPEEPDRAPTVTASFPEPEIAYASESPPPVPPPLPSFRDLSLVDMTYLCPYRPELLPLLSRPIEWDLASGAPTVLIFHTHTTESYERSGADYQESAPYRTTDERYNMLSIGQRIQSTLEDSGIVTIHDRSFHDYPNYNGCYGRSRKSTVQYLKEYPSLRLILDLHRDACDSADGQLRTLAQVKGQDSAQLMLVVGSNAGGQSHKRWQENLSLALQLQAQLETQCPGIVRPISFRSQRFNQDLSPGSLLIEVGGAGNSHQEALLAADQLAQAIIALCRGTGDRPEPRPGI